VEVVIARDAEECAVHVADLITEAMVDGARVLGLATGSSPLAVYDELIRRHRGGLGFADVSAFLLDEYVGLPPGHPACYRQVIRDVFTEHVDLPPDRVHGPDGSSGDPATAAVDYERLLNEKGPIDVQLLGIGANGHIGFNEPTSSLASRTRVKTLTPKTREDNARFFDAPDQVPLHVITQGLATICEARHLVLIATGAAKAEAVAAAVEGPLSARCPASVLQLHPRATVVVDEAAAARLELAEYYHQVMAHKSDPRLHPSAN
jgi:glucosamine-6-phosphate deaminase